MSALHLWMCPFDVPVVCVRLCLYSQVQATNDSSVASKRCMAEAGYFDDPFLSHFTPKRSRTALINRCAVAVCLCMPVLLVIVSHTTQSYNWYV